MGTFLKCVVLGLMDNARVAVHEHTVGRLRRVWLTATYPLVTERADDGKLWRASLRTAWKGLVNRHPDALDYFVFMRRNVEATRQMKRMGDAAKQEAEQRRARAVRDLFDAVAADRKSARG